FKARGPGKWPLFQSGLFLDFLAGNQTYGCTPWGNPTRTVFGWQRPCYLLGEGYARTFAELMEDTDWNRYGTGNYEKCADCMVHSGFEASAVTDAVKRPWKAAKVALAGIKTEGRVAPEPPPRAKRREKCVSARPAKKKLAKREKAEPRTEKRGAAK